MGVKRGLHHCNANLLWSNGTALYGLSEPNILQFGELSTVRGKTSTRNEPFFVGQAPRIGNRRRNPQT